MALNKDDITLWNEVLRELTFNELDTNFSVIRELIDEIKSLQQGSSNDANALKKDQNLSDVIDAIQARNNLGLYDLGGLD